MGLYTWAQYTPTLAFAVFGGWGSVPVVVLAGNFLRGEEDAGSASLTFELLYALGAFIM